MSQRRLGRALLLAVTFCGVSVAAEDVPDRGPRLRDCDSRDCQCVQSSIDHNQKIVEGYRRLANSYRDTLKDLGNGKVSPTWVDPATLSRSQMARLIALKKAFSDEEREMAKQAPERDCGFPDDIEIVLVTDSLTCEPPSEEDQKKYKRLFPCEQVYDAVMMHEYYHAGECDSNNRGRNRPAGNLPRTRTPYGQALEEAKGYEIEIAELEKLKNNCPRAEGSVPNRGERFAQHQRLQRAVRRVSAYAASIS